MVSLSRAEMREEGLEEETRGTDQKPDKGFEYNPAKQSWRPDLQKYAEKLRVQVEEDLAQRRRDAEG